MSHEAPILAKHVPFVPGVPVFNRQLADSPVFPETKDIRQCRTADTPELVAEPRLIQIQTKKAS